MNLEVTESARGSRTCTTIKVGMDLGLSKKGIRWHRENSRKSMAECCHDQYNITTSSEDVNPETDGDEVI